MKFNQLVRAIGATNETSKLRAAQGVNVTYTLRNWMIGAYIVEYEQNGEDRARYGDKLVIRLSSKLTIKRIPGVSYRSLEIYKQFYRSYPQIVQTVSAQFPQLETPLLTMEKIVQTASAQSGKKPDSALLKIRRTKSDESKTNTTVPGGYPVKKTLSLLTFSHFVELLKVDDPLKRAFYELQAIQCNWNVRELKRNIGSLLFERSTLSKDKKSLLKKLSSKTPLQPQDMIREPYILEFIGLPEKKEFTESDLETALLNHLQKFLMELGRGFCFEARQQRITVNNRHFHVDLVFYHRVLKCHVLIDLKTREFAHEDAGQMNFYLNYYREEQMEKGDNPPVGILLCTHNDEAEVKFATTGLPNKLFVSRYKLELPSEKELTDFVKRDLKRIGRER